MKIKCGNCGKRFDDSYKSGKDGKYYHLTNTKRRGLFQHVNREECKGK